jgi:hypothetical protein
MTVTIELKPEIETRIAEQAAAQGVTVEEYIQRFLESIIAASKPATAQERVQRFEHWLKNHTRSAAPPLSDEAISRERIYTERENNQL